jgi:hypothetical protein
MQKSWTSAVLISQGFQLLSDTFHTHVGEEYTSRSTELFVLTVSLLCSVIYVSEAWARIAQMVLRLATGWTVRGSNPGGVRFFAHVPTGPGAHSVPCTMGTGSFPGVKRLGHGADHLLPPSAEVENE